MITFTQWGVLKVIIGTENILNEPDPVSTGGGRAKGFPASLVSSLTNLFKNEKV